MGEEERRNTKDQRRKSPLGIRHRGAFDHSPRYPHTQAPCETVDGIEQVARAGNDTYKGQTAVTAELDHLVSNVTNALKRTGMWDDTLIIFTSDNGGPLDHTTNYPLRGGKHTFWEGGVRVVAAVGESGADNV